MFMLWHICPKQELLNHRNLKRHATIELCLRRTSVCCLLLDNSQIKNVFAAVSAMTVAMQWFGKHVSTIEAEFSVWSAQRLYNVTLEIFAANSVWSQFSFGEFSVRSRWEVNAVTVNNSRGRSTWVSHQQGNELGLGAQKKTRNQPVKN
jgi:hypothetical protein